MMQKWKKLKWLINFLNETMFDKITRRIRTLSHMVEDSTSNM